VESSAMVGKGREAIAIMMDPGSVFENVIDDYRMDPDLGPGAVIGSARIQNQPVTLIANDARVINPRFRRVVYAGIIGLEEAYKMARAVYWTIESDRNKALAQKRPIILIVDTPGNAAGKLEEVLGINNSTGAYQLALAEARKTGHPVVAVIIGRAISGGFLCHGLQADHILSLSQEFGTMIHVMPLTSIARITKIDIKRLEEMAKTNPIFAAGVNFFCRLGGIEEILYTIEELREATIRHIDQVRKAKMAGESDRLGPWGRGLLGAQRGGRKTRLSVIQKMREEFEEIALKYLGLS
jgi:malonyl-S-ACP:biotin-protein carboxyltransferase subunit MadD